MEGRKIFIWAFLLVIITAIVLTIASLTKIKYIDISIIGKYNDIQEDRVIEASGVLYDDNIITISKEKIIENIQSELHNVKVIDIERKFPNRLVISVMERKPLLAIKIRSANKYAICDIDGYIMTVSDQISNYIVMDGVEIPVADGAMVNSLEGTYIDTTRYTEIAEVINLFQAFSRVKFSEDSGYDSEVCVGLFESISFMDNTDNIIIETRTGVRIKIVSVAVDTLLKAEQAISVYDSLNDTQKKSGEILVSSSNESSYIP